MDANKPDRDSILRRERDRPSLWRRLHEETSGVAATEYIIVFSLITFGAAMALIGTAAFVKAYADFLIWWFAHPAV